MQDRVPLYPGRVTMTPVEGQANTYDMVRADQPTQAGTSLSKANLLKDTTAAQFGLGAEAVPDDVLSWLGKYNEYWWSLLHGQAYSYYKLNFAPISSFISYSNSSTSNKVYYSYSLDFDENTGSYSLHEPENITMHTGDISQYKKDVAALAALAADAPFYMYTQGNGTIYKVPQGATAYDGTAQMTQTFTYYTYRDSDDDLVRNYGYGTGNPVSAISVEFIQVPAGETTYEHSTNRNAYPDSGTVDGVTYTFLGKPFEKFPTMPQIETGTYIGTGTYGSGNPNTLTFGFPPKLVIVSRDGHSQGYLSTAGVIILHYGMPSYNDRIAHSYTTSNDVVITWNGNSVSWYNPGATSDGFQMNNLNTVYYYTAFG